MNVLSTSETAALRAPRARASRSIAARPAAIPRLWEPLAALAMLLLAALLSFFQLDRQGYGNTYYAAAVKSMLTSWRSFFFASFDSGGFVSVDKPPLGLWVQAASAKLVGFSGPSLFLPQVLAGLLSVAVLYYLVRRAFGPPAGLLAGLALAVTPISVVTNRNNTMDSQLVLALLLAAWAATLAAESGRLRWLLACAALVGLGFNIKMLQAYPLVPAFGLMYLLYAPLRRLARLGHLALATVVLLAVSLSWSAVVDLTPPTERPYVGSSGTNSALSLALGYNGLGRVTQALASRIPVPDLPGVTIDLSQAPAFAPQIGTPSLLRLVRPGVADQASWLLPLALLGLLVAGWQATSRFPLARARLGMKVTANGSTARSPVDGHSGTERRRRRRVALVLWGGWLLAWGAYFSFARFYHLYYLVMLGPGAAALAAIGVAALWRAYRRAGWGAWLLPIGLLGTAALQLLIVAGYPARSGWLAPAIALPCLAAVAVLIAQRRSDRPCPAAVAAAVGALALLVAPTVWAGLAVRDGNGGAWLVQAGPSGPFGGGVRSPQGGLGGPFGQAGGPFASGPTPFAGVQAPAGPGGPGPFPGRGRGAFTFAGDQWDRLDPALVQYLQANHGSARYLVATPTSSYASLFMLVTDQPAMALGGYQGWDRILTPARLAEQVADGTVRFFLLDAAGQARPANTSDATADLAAWVRATCAAVPPEQWRTSPAGPSGAAAPDGPPARAFGPGLQSQQLYDCATSVGRAP